MRRPHAGSTNSSSSRTGAGRKLLSVNEIDEVLSTTRAVRKRLDFDRPVERDVIEECLQLALQAPTGSNRQGWHFVVVTRPELKQEIARHYQASWAEYAKIPARYAEDDPRHRQFPRVVSSAQYLADRMGEVPLMLLACIHGRVEGRPNQEMAGLYGSILPAAWSFMLAARARGIGTSWTTLHLAFEREVAEVLGIPYDKVTQAALIVGGYFTGEGFKPAERLPLDRVVHWDRW